MAIIHKIMKALIDLQLSRYWRVSIWDRPSV